MVYYKPLYLPLIPEGEEEGEASCTLLHICILLYSFVLMDADCPYLIIGIYMLINHGNHVMCRRQ